MQVSSSSLPSEIRLFRPSLGAEELAAVSGTFDRSWVGLGGQVTEFENEFSTYLGCNSALGVNSGTAALQLALEAFGFAKGKKVLVNNLTFVASATCILINGLVPVLIDCDPDTLGIDLEDASKKVDADTVAIVVVHYGGHPASMDKILSFAAAHGLKVVEDCAHCPGGSYQGKKLGTWGDIGCFSFEEKKGMTTGDGGMLVSNDKELVDRMRPHRWVGIDKDTWRRRDSYTDARSKEAKHWHYEVAVLGYKYNMNDLCASIGRVQLRKLDQFNSRRRSLISRYLERLQEAPHIRPLLPYELEESSYWLFGIRTPNRDEVILHLKERRIATGVHYMPLALHPLFSEFNKELPVSNTVWEQLLTLPLHTELADEDVNRVAAEVISCTNSIHPI